MRIVYLVPGPAGPFFEKNSLREQALVADLRWCGHDVLLVPLLFPLTPNAGIRPDTADIPVRGGAVRIYSRHALPTLARYAPDWLWRRLDAPWLRRKIAHRVLDSPKRFSEFMRDALDGRNGPLVAEMENLGAWLQQQRKPDMLLLSTPFLLGTAAMLKRRVSAPVCCAMNSELEDMSHLRGPEGIILLTKLRGMIADADGFIPVSHFHAERIQNRFGIPEQTIRTVHPGIDCADFTPAPLPPEPAIGIIVRGASEREDLAMPHIVSLLQRLVFTPPIALKVARAANLLPSNPRQQQTAETGIKVETLPESVAKLSHFFSSFTILIFLHGAPAPAFNYLVLEALASGIPVVLPDTGANAEIAAFCPAVFLYQNADSLTRQTQKILALSRDTAHALRLEARRSVEHYFSLPRMAQETADALQTIINRCTRRQDTWAIRPATPPVK